MFESSYDHTQKAPWFLLLFAFAALFFTVAWVTRAEPVVPAILVVAGLLMAMLGYSFQHLTVCDEGDRLAICFGPLPLFKRRIPYDDMTGVEIGRTTIMESGSQFHKRRCSRRSIGGSKIPSRQVYHIQ